MGKNGSSEAKKSTFIEFILGFVASRLHGFNNPFVMDSRFVLSGDQCLMMTMTALSGGQEYLVSDSKWGGL